VNVSVSISMPLDLLADIDKASSGLTRSEFVCRALESALGQATAPAIMGSSPDGEPQGSRPASSRAPKVSETWRR
jgi:hypothetical protein